ncbi:hypothetical protein XU18_2399 [Perkinsela sp. CCAP 1560/4]|nr:hypothetical protein XU18_2399 [Perkinsela sp. CCAP 1560/4]|eukprot:KNH06797.1 hypothetical protein XU18_2399 [Perkinsela sp. CCAP 1560/4]
MVTNYWQTQSGREAQTQLLFVHHGFLIGKLNAECPCKADIRVVRSKSATGPVCYRISCGSVFVHTQCAIIFPKASAKGIIQLDSFQQYAESTPAAVRDF